MQVYFINQHGLCNLLTVREKKGKRKYMSPNVGLEPTTLRLRVSCSTD